MGILKLIYESFVQMQRVNVVSRLLAEHIPHDSSVLDIGCGDGTLAASIMASRKDLRIEGVDVMVRPSVHIHVREYDGLKLPFPDDSVDVAIFVDVLHHAEQPLAVLSEAARVAGGKIIIKDHLRQGFMAQTRLKMMDWMGNARYGVSLPYRYWTRSEWEKAFFECGLAEETFLSGLRLYRFPLQWFFGGSLHFISVLDIKAKKESVVKSRGK